MSWWYALPAIIQGVGGIASAASEDGSAAAENTVNEANAFANNLVRSANNKLKGARGSLARYNQSVNNQRVLENAGNQAEAAAVNYRRMRDSAMNDSFEQQLQFAEQAGAQSAAAAFTGLRGGVADIVTSTTALRKARIEQRVSEATKQGDWDASQQQKHIMQAGWDSLDHSEISDDLDYSTDVAIRKEPIGNVFTQFIGGALKGGGLQTAAQGFFNTGSYDAFKDRAGPAGSGYGGNGRTITGGR